MTDRIATVTSTTLLLDNNLRLQSQYAARQTQVVTGLKSQSYTGIADDSNLLLNLEADVLRINGQIANSETALNRTDATYNALSDIITQSQTFLADLNATISSTGPTGDQLAELAEVALDNIAASLNTQFGNTFIFSGTTTNIRPVDLDDPDWGGQVLVPILPLTDPVTYDPLMQDFDYYQGNDGVQSVEISDGFTIDYNIRANDPVIEQIFTALDLIITTPLDEDTLEIAYETLEAAISDLNVIRAEVGQDAGSINDKITENETQLNLISQIVIDAREVDLAEATVRLQEIEAQIEASYSVTTRALRLSITNFIN